MNTIAIISWISAAVFATNCPSDSNIGAILYELPSFAGTKHWIDNANSSYCRGLNGTQILSLEVVNQPGGDPIYNRTSEPYAQGVNFTFFDNYDCQGNSVLFLTGNHQTDIAGQSTPALSVLIDCNDDFNASGNGSEPIGQQFHYAITKKMDNGTVYTSWQDSHLYECAGSNGDQVTAIKFVSSPGADPATASIPDEESKQISLKFYTEYGCTGEQTVLAYGNEDMSTVGNDYNIHTKSFMIVKSANFTGTPTFKENSNVVQSSPLAVTPQ